MPDEPTSPAAIRDDRDLYCLQCGYNLRGLSGDPRRCPECGHENPLSAIELPAKLIKAELRKMESAQAGCVFAAFGMALFAGLAIYFARSTGFGETGDIDKQIICWAAAGASAIGWFIAALLFRAYCDRQKGWARALWGYHWRSAVVTTVIVLLVWPRTGDYVWRLLPLGLAGCGMPILVFAGVIVPGSLWVRGWAKHGLEPLQRHVAVKFAWDQLMRQAERRIKRGRE